MRISLVGTIILALLCLLPSISHASEVRTFDDFCDMDGYTNALRQTVVVVDGRLVKSEKEGGIDSANRPWREFIANLLNAEDPSIQQRFAPRERVTIAVAENDGSGTRNIFTGCLPTYSKEEKREDAKKDTAWGDFLGGGLNAKLRKEADAFRQAMLVSLAEGAKTRGQANGVAKEALANSTLVSSLSRGLGIARDNGILRVIIYSDLAQYVMPAGTVEEARKQARGEAESSGVDLMNSEVHIVGIQGAGGGAGGEYIKAFFLASKGKVETLTGIDGTIRATNPPVKVEIFQGQIKYPDGPATMRMRLALDRNGTAVNSWAEVITDRSRFTPFGGVLTCKNDDECEFVGDKVFAQIWSDDPAPEPDFASWMPFGGFREFAFKLTGGHTAVGKIFDSSGYVPTMEDGLPFELNLASN